MLTCQNNTKRSVKIIKIRNISHEKKISELDYKKLNDV